MLSFGKCLIVTMLLPAPASKWGLTSDSSYVEAVALVPYDGCGPGPFANESSLRSAARVPRGS